jgi:hypothetical protein
MINNNNLYHEKVNNSSPLPVIKYPAAIVINGGGKAKWKKSL